MPTSSGLHHTPRAFDCAVTVAQRARLAVGSRRAAAKSHVDGEVVAIARDRRGARHRAVEPAAANAALVGGAGGAVAGVFPFLHVAAHVEDRVVGGRHTVTGGEGSRGLQPADVAALVAPIGDVAIAVRKGVRASAATGEAPLARARGREGAERGGPAARCAAQALAGPLAERVAVAPVDAHDRSFELAGGRRPYLRRP